MGINLIAFSKLKETWLQNQIKNYQDRCRKWIPVEHTELKESVKNTPAERLREEATLYRSRRKGTPLLWVMAEEGKTFSSAEFAREITKAINVSNNQLDILIGSAYGVDADLKKEAAKLVSLSPMTFTHDWARVLVMEQIYRAQCILNNHPYHHI